MKKVITDEEYSVARAQYESGYARIKDIADGLGIKYETLRKRFKADGVTPGVRINTSGLEKEIPEVRDLKQNYAGWLDAVSRRALLIIGKATKEEIPLGNFRDDLRVLKDIGDILNKNYATSAKILRVDEGATYEELPEFVVTEMTADDVEDIRANQREELAELTGEGQV